MGVVLVLAARWDGLVRALEGAPRPATAAEPLAVAGASEGERALAEARRRLERGDRAGALLALDRIPPHEPEYPLARQLREEARGTSRRAGR